MLSCDTPCASDAPCYCRRVNAARAGRPTDYHEHPLRRGILSLTPGTPEHAARVAQRSCTDAERDGL